MTELRFPSDEGKSENYIRRRNLLLEQMRKQKWDDPEECAYKKRGRKIKPQPQAVIDLTKPRNKSYNWIK